MSQYQDEAYALMFNEETGAPEEVFFSNICPFICQERLYYFFLAFVGVLFGSIAGSLLAFMKPFLRQNFAVGLRLFILNT